MSKAKLKINYSPHTGQKEVLDKIMASGADVIEIVCSRGWGKTLFTALSLAVPVAVKHSNYQICWIAPNYKIAKAPIDDVFFGINEDTGERFINDRCAETGFKFFEHKKGDNELHFWNGSKIFLRSADAPDSIVSKGYNLVIIDEAALINKDVWEKNILPIARRKNCKIILISTPRGKNWFYNLFLDGKDSSKPRYFSIQQPWWKRPDYPPLLIDLMKDLPQHIRDQEFNAMFLDGGGGVFKNLDKIFLGDEINFQGDRQEWFHPEWKTLSKNQPTVMGVDFAKSVDFTVISIMTYDRKLIYYARFNKSDYKVVLEKIKKLGIQFNYPEVIYDGTGVGSGLSDFMPSELNSFPFIFTNQSKLDLVNKMIVATEYEKLLLPNIVTIKNEFEIFEFNYTKTGKIIYQAPDGKHDDCVYSMALCNWFIEENEGKSEVGEIDDFLNTVNEVRLGLLEDEDDLNN